MKEKILSIISLITVLIPFTVVFFWNPANEKATAILIGYCIFIAFSFCYSLFLFVKLKLRDTNIKIGLVINSLYVFGILTLVIIPRLI